MNDKGKAAILSASGFGLPPPPKVKPKSKIRGKTLDWFVSDQYANISNDLLSKITGEFYKKEQDRFAKEYLCTFDVPDEYNFFDKNDLTHVTYSNTTSTAPISLSEMMRVVESLPPGPTEEQSRWAKDHGFIDWNGIKVSPEIYGQLQEHCPIKSSKGEPFELNMFSGCPLIVDHSLLPNEWVTAPHAWKHRHYFYDKEFSRYGMFRPRQSGQSLQFRLSEYY